jgi:hypothetical protein
MLIRAALTGMVAAGLTCAPLRLPAQTVDPRTLVVLGLDEAAREPGLAIYMRPGSFPQVVIAVPPGTSPEELAGAFKVLDRTQKDFKKSNKQLEANSFMRIRVPQSATRKSLGNKEREAYAGYLALFASSPVMHLPGIGSGRAVEVEMPKWPDKETKASP